MRSSRAAQSAAAPSRTPASGSERRPLASPEELSAYLGVPLGTLYSWNHRGVGPKATKVGRHLRYRWQEVDAWVDAQTTDNDAA
ncbi:helix-turn-helix domain-containing protein [Streptomyces sp. B22F1]|uniref:helix-turn-helix transcriptional regulator n=1 Tax=Streptomyces sp. B22F1 TaxID=3153566 RepID=UPI00325F0AAB